MLVVLTCLTLCGAPPSVSVGNASDGHLINGKQLPARGEAHEVMRGTRRRGLHWGTDELVGALKRAAASVATAQRGSMLLVGNMSLQGGGDIGPSVSHNSGRDADLGFYAMDTRGRPVRTPTLVVFDDDGVAGTLRFDTRRNWLLVRAFLTDKAVQVQWIFCKNALRRRLLEHATKAGEPAELVARAAEVLGEPGNSSAHAEHFHVRLYCARHDRLAGCRNYGPTHAWVDDFQSAVDDAARTAAADLTGPDARALAALDRLKLLRSGVVGGELVRVVEDSKRARRLRLAALEVLELLPGLGAHADRLAARLSETDGELLVALTRVVAHIAATSTAEALAGLATRTGAPSAARTKALEGLGRLRHGPALPRVAPLLGDPRLAKGADEVLLRTTGRTFGTGKKGVAKWEAWWSKNATGDRLGWVWSALVDGGAKAATGKTRLRTMRRLVGLMRPGGALALLARELVHDATGYWLEQGHFTDRQMLRFYTAWLKAGAPSAAPAGGAEP